MVKTLFFFYRNRIKVYGWSVTVDTCGTGILQKDLPSTFLQVGFMTYDNKINFYNCTKALAQPQQMTVGDVQVGGQFF